LSCISYDPETTISDRVEFENERVEFLTGIANLMATKARLKLNTKKLYASDGRAVQELLKLATLLYRCGVI
jgi:clusterin-associated protein 1